MDKNKDTYKSHIVLTQQLMRSYQIKTENGKQVKYLDLKTNQIGQKKIKDVDAEEKYFDAYTEEFLNKKIETPFADVYFKIEKILTGKLENKITTKDLNIIRRFFQYTLLRSKETYSRIFKDSIFAPIIQNFSPSMALAFAPATNDMFDKKRISIIYNKNKEYGFVCPHNVVYYFYSELHKSYNLAISINCRMIVCLNLEQTTNHVDVLEMNDNINIRAINCAAYLVEKYHDSKYIVGKEEDLIRLQEDITTLEEDKKDLICVDIK